MRKDRVPICGNEGILCLILKDHPLFVLYELLSHSALGGHSAVGSPDPNKFMEHINIVLFVELPEIIVVPSSAAFIPKQPELHYRLPVKHRSAGGRSIDVIKGIQMIVGMHHLKFLPVEEPGEENSAQEAVLGIGTVVGIHIVVGWEDTRIDPIRIQVLTDGGKENREQHIIIVQKRHIVAPA